MPWGVRPEQSYKLLILEEDAQDLDANNRRLSDRQRLHARDTPRRYLAAYLPRLAPLSQAQLLLPSVAQPCRT